MFSKMNSLLRWSAQLALAFAIQCGISSTLTRAQGRVDVVRFPDYWTRIDSDGMEVVLPSIIYKIWKLPGKNNGELLFGGAVRGEEGLTVGYGGKKLKQEWAGPIPDAAEKRYSMNFFAVSFGESSPRVRKLSEKEHLIGEPVLNGYHYISAHEQRIDVYKNSPSSLRYAGKLFAKSGRAWSDIIGIVSPGGKWLAVLSYTSPEKRTKSHGLFDGGGEPERGIVHVDIYNAATGEKALAAKHSYRAEPSSIFNDSVWVKERYLVMPLDFDRRICLLLTLPGQQ
jgi:hypothetical protein